MQDNRANLVIHSYVDSVIANLCKLLGVAVSDYSKNCDPTFMAAEQEASKGKSFIEWTLPEPTTVQNNVKTKKKGVSKRKFDDDSTYSPSNFKPENKTVPKSERPVEKFIKTEVCSEMAKATTDNDN